MSYEIRMAEKMIAGEPCFLPWFIPETKNILMNVAEEVTFYLKGRYPMVCIKSTSFRPRSEKYLYAARYTLAEICVLAKEFPRVKVTVYPYDDKFGVIINDPDKKRYVYSLSEAKNIRICLDKPKKRFSESNLKISYLGYTKPKYN